MTQIADTLILAVLSCVLLMAVSSSEQIAQIEDDQCGCDTFTIEHKTNEFVYPLAWLPHIQAKILFSVNTDHDVTISLSKHTKPNDPRYLVVLQEDNTNRAAIKRCHANSSYVCADETVVTNSSPYLINGTKQYYWMSIGSDFSLQVGRGGDEKSFMSYTPSFGTEIGIQWIGLSAANSRVTWGFCNQVLKEVARQKPSYQSSNLYEGKVTYNASRANDFDTNLHLPGLCSQTAYIDVEPWWRVDLKVVYNVNMVRLWNDIEDQSHLLSGVTIYVGSLAAFKNQQIREQSKICGAGVVTKYEAEKDTVIVRRCDYSSGKYVYLIKKAPILKLCGVEVFGYQDSANQKSSNDKPCKDITNNDDTRFGRVILPCVIIIILTIIIAGTAWLFVAYMHPTSSSGILLLKIRSWFRKDAVSSGPVAKYSLVSPSTV